MLAVKVIVPVSFDIFRVPSSYGFGAGRGPVLRNA